MSNETRYTIEVNESQLYALMNAIENESRIMLGQFDVLKDICYRHNGPKISWDEMRDVEWQLKQMFYPELSLNAYHGIHSDQIPNRARTLFDLYQVMRNVVAWNHSLVRQWTVNFDDPYVTDNENPLPIVKVINQDPYYDVYLSFFKRLQHSITQMITKRGWVVNSPEYNEWIEQCKQFALHEHHYITLHQEPLPSEEYNEFFNVKVVDGYIVWNDEGDV